jgi:hypothetical protein
MAMKFSEIQDADVTTGNYYNNQFQMTGEPEDNHQQLPSLDGSFEQDKLQAPNDIFGTQPRTAKRYLQVN